MILWGDLHVQEEWFTKLSSEPTERGGKLYFCTAFVLFPLPPLIQRKSYAGDYPYMGVNKTLFGIACNHKWKITDKRWQKNAPQNTNTLTAGGFHKQYKLNTTATCSQAAAFPSCLIFAQGNADHRQEGLAAVAS